MTEASSGRRPSGELEAAALDRLLAAGHSLTPGELRAQLGHDLARTTVATILSRMHDKGLVTRVPSGRGYAYSPAADASGLTARRMHAELNRGEDRLSVLARFVSELSEQDGAALRTLLSDMGGSEA